MTYHILVKPSGFSFDVEEGETVLAAALRCGYFFPHLCRMGVCGTCRGRLLAGDIDYAGREILGLTPEEQEQGYVLFCSAKPKSDLVIYVKNVGVAQLSAPSEWIYDVVSTQLVSKATTRILLRPSNDAQLFYQAGQYIKVLHPNGDVSPLSLANAPQENLFIELHLTHPFSHAQAQDVLRVISEEQKLIFRGPYGVCTAAELLTEQPVIFLARGSGVASIKSIIEEMKTFKKYPRMHFYWSVTSPDEFYLNDLLTEWTNELQNFSYTPVLSRPYKDWSGRVGLLQDVVLEDYPDVANYRVYISAPEPIVHDVLHQLQRAGLPRNYYYSDIFDYNPHA